MRFLRIPKAKDAKGEDSVVPYNGDTTTCGYHADTEDELLRGYSSILVSCSNEVYRRDRDHTVHRTMRDISVRPKLYMSLISRKRITR